MKVVHCRSEHIRVSKTYTAEAIRNSDNNMFTKFSSDLKISAVKFPSCSDNVGSGDSLSIQHESEITELQTEVQQLKKSLRQSELEREKLASQITSGQQQLKVHNLVEA